MFGKDYFFSKLNYILTKVPADQVEITCCFKDFQLSRFANNYIHQNLAEKNFNITLKAIINQKMSVISINSFEDNIVNNAIKKLIETINFLPIDEKFISLAKPIKNIDYKNYFDESLVDYSPIKRAEHIKTITDEAKRKNVSSSGFFSTAYEEIAIVNSLGVNSYDKLTEVEALSFVSDEMEGYSYDKSRYLKNIDITNIAKESVNKCVKARNPIEIEPNSYPVVLDGYGVAEILEYLCKPNFNAKTYNEGLSCVSNRLGEKVTGDLISINNDPFEKNALPYNIDLEGIPIKKVSLIDKGFANGVVHNSYTANQKNITSTGNKVSPMSNTPYPSNIVMEKGNKTTKELINSIEDGLYITKLNYLSPIDNQKTIMTGLTRGGCFLIKNGEIDRSIYNLRFTENIFEMFKKVSLVSSERKMDSDNLAPAIKIDSMKFTGKTKPTS